MGYEKPRTINSMRFKIMSGKIISGIEVFEWAKITDVAAVLGMMIPHPAVGWAVASTGALVAASPIIMESCYGPHSKSTAGSRARWVRYLVCLCWRLRRRRHFIRVRLRRIVMVTTCHIVLVTTCHCSRLYHSQLLLAGAWYRLIGLERRKP